jgi:hypothetical protein
MEKNVFLNKLVLLSCAKIVYAGQKQNKILGSFLFIANCQRTEADVLHLQEKWHPMSFSLGVGGSLY